MYRWRGQPVVTIEKQKAGENGIERNVYRLSPAVGFRVFARETPETKETANVTDDSDYTVTVGGRKMSFEEFLEWL